MSPTVTLNVRKTNWKLNWPQNLNTMKQRLVTLNLFLINFYYYHLSDPPFRFPLPDRDRFQLGTLSHSLNTKATGYQELSDWPDVAPDQSVRNVEVIEPVRNPLCWHTSPRSDETQVFTVVLAASDCLSRVVWSTSLFTAALSWSGFRRVFLPENKLTILQEIFWSNVWSEFKTFTSLTNSLLTFNGMDYELPNR